MEKNGGGGDRIPRFSIPNDSEDDGCMGEDKRQQEVTLATLNNVFSKDLQIFHTVDDEINEVWAHKPPKIVNDYLFGREIGLGSYGKVKEVLHRETGVRRAVKIMKDKKVCKIPSGLNNVEREFHILETLNHQNVIKLIESFRINEKEKVYYIFEFCVISIQGMLDHAEPSRMNEYQSHYYFKQLITGLDYLHTMGIIHKDIKPQNLLITEENVLKIADFGVAEMRENPDDDWCFISQGTPALQAPEIVAGDLTDFRGKCVDIWASGVTLFRMVAGVYPFDGNVLMKLFENIISEQFTVPKDVIVSQNLMELITGMLVKDPEKRWTIKMIKECSWMTSFHELDQNHLIPLPEVDNSYFEVLLRQLDEDPDNVHVYNDCEPFVGVYPPTVQDRTLQTPASSRTFRYDREVVQEQQSSSAPAFLKGSEVNVPPSVSSPHPKEEEKAKPKKNKSSHRLFACLRPQHHSPEDSPE